MVAVYDVLRSDMDRWWTTDEILRTLGDWPPTPSQREIVRRAIHLLAEDEVALVRLGKPLRVLGKPVPVANRSGSGRRSTVSATFPRTAAPWWGAPCDQGARAGLGVAHARAGR